MIQLNFNQTRGLSKVQTLVNLTTFVSS